MDFLTQVVNFLKPDKVPEEAGTPEFVFTNLPQSLGVFVFVGVGILLLYLTYLFYKKEAVPISGTAKGFLIGLRWLVLLVLLAVLLGPAVRYFSIRTIEPTIYMGLDGSISMVKEDKYRNEEEAKIVARGLGMKPEELRGSELSRAEIVRRVLNSPAVSVATEEKEDGAGGDDGEGTLLSKIGELGTLKIFDFSSGLNQLEGVGAYSPKGQLTDLTLTLNEALKDKNTSAIVLFTDGQQTAKSDPKEIAKKAGEQGIPVFIVGIGDEERPKNIEVVEVYIDPKQPKDDLFEIQVKVRALGLNDEAIDLELIEIIGEGDAKTENVIDRRTLDLEGKSQIQTIFSHSVSEAGTRAYTVRAKAVEGETNEDDNEPASPATVTILDQKARVLLISGLPTWGYRSVTQLLTREPSIDLSCWLQSIDDGRAQPGNTPIVVMPATKEELFKYDVVLMFDPDPTEFDAEWVELLKEFVRDHHGGCLYQAGPNFTSQFLTGERTKSLASFLPVKMGDISEQELIVLLKRNDVAHPLGVKPATVDQPMMRFFPEPNDSLEAWKSLPGVYWSFPAKEAKPGARVLIENTDPDDISPLLVSGRYGSGRIVYMGFNSSWRWRQVGRDAEYFQRFWIQTVRFLIEGKTQEGRRRGTVEAERQRYNLGDRVLMVADDLKTANMETLETESVSALWTRPSGEEIEVEMKSISGQPGTYEHMLSPKELGVHKFEVTGLDTGLTNAVIQTNFTISLPLVETEKIWLNKPLLTEMASVSEGNYFTISETADLLKAIPDNSREDRVPRPPIPLWDSGWILGLLVGLLCIEWIARKRLKLL